MSRMKDMTLPIHFQGLRHSLISAEWEVVNSSPLDDFLMFTDKERLLKLVMQYGVDTKDAYPDGCWKLSVLTRKGTYTIETEYHKIPSSQQEIEYFALTVKNFLRIGRMIPNFIQE